MVTLLPATYVRLNWLGFLKQIARPMEFKLFPQVVQAMPLTEQVPIVSRHNMHLFIYEALEITGLLLVNHKMRPQYAAFVIY